MQGAKEKYIIDIQREEGSIKKGNIWKTLNKKKIMRKEISPKSVAKSRI